MGPLQIPKPTFEAHPAGPGTGRIAEVEDKGEQPTAFGVKHKIAVKIESDRLMNDGRPYLIVQWFSLSGHPKSALRKFREGVLGRSLSEEEAYNFDPGQLVGRQIGFAVTHVEGKEGPYANLSAVWPLGQPAPGASSGPDSPPPMPAGLAGPAEIEYAVKLIAVCQASGMYSEADAEKTTDWAESGVLQADMARFIGQCEAALKARGVVLPETPGPQAPALPAAPMVPGGGGKDGLPF